MTTTTVIPPGITWTDVPRSPDLGDAMAAWAAMYQLMQSMGFTKAPVDVILSGGVLTMAQSLTKIIPEAGADTDTLDRIDLDSVADGRVIFLSPADSDYTITITHRLGGIADVGEISLIYGADIELGREDDWLVLQRRGGVFYQLRWIGFGQTEPLTKDLDMAGFRAYNGGYRIITVAGATATITPGYRGQEAVSTTGCTYTLPAAQPAPPAEQWKVGDVVYFRQEGAHCIFVAASGATLRSLDAHDRGRGVGAKMEIELVQITPSFVWNLVGMTQAPGGGGGGAIQRSYAYVSGSGTITTDAASTAWKNAQRLTHTPPDNSKWLYFGHALFTSSANLVNSAAEMRFTDGSTTKTFGAPRYSTQKSAPLLLHGVSYGVTPGSKNIDIDIKSGNTAYSASAGLGKIVGLKLETGDFLSLGAGAADNVTTTSYAAKLTMTETFASDDYYIFAWCEYDTVNSLIPGMSIKVVVDGADKHIKVLAKHGAHKGYYACIVPTVFLAGSKTITLQGKSEAGHNSSMTNMGICALRATLFEDFTGVDSFATDTTGSTSYVDKATLSHSLLAGWEYLLISDVDLMLDNEAGNTGAMAQTTRNGSRLGHEARENARIANVYAPVSTGALEVIQKNLATDGFAVQVKSNRSGDTVTYKEATMLLLALGEV